MQSGALQIDSIRSGLRTQRVGRRIEYLETTTSTNDDAWQWIDTPDADGLVVVAEHQSAGRGRFGRVWESPRGASLLCSIVLVDVPGALSGTKLGLLSAVACCDAIKESTGVASKIRWPNDLLVSGRKLGGILIETRLRHDRARAFVMGVGINCLQQHGHLSGELAETATSLELESHAAIDRNALLRLLLVQFDRWLAEPDAWDDARLRDQWLARAEEMGARVQLRQGSRLYSGVMVGLDPGAALLVQLDDGGMRAFNAADTTIVRAEPGLSG